MKKTQLLAMTVAAILAVDSLTPILAEASSVTDLQQQTENLVNDDLDRILSGRNGNSSGSEAENAAGGNGQNGSGSGSNSSEQNEGDTPEEDSDVDTKAVSVNQYETVRISSVTDFNKFAENCRTDTWSTDKKAVLDTDLNFNGEEFEPVKSFGGIFDGNGHTIKGVLISKEVDSTGIFGTIRRSGKVLNLKVKGKISPKNTQRRLGGIAGCNYGSIENCSFDGTISADRELGGIAGYNDRYGSIIQCSAEGSLTGKAASGGIVGYNEGTVSKCRNDMKVNTTYRDTTMSLSELTSTLDDAVQSGNILNSENLETNGDTGGIAGFSSGVVTSCTNNATIGYEHVGYNVGGIVGRSSGFLQNNVNNGTVYGRKDTGGIAGQMQPYLAVDFTKQSLDDLDGQLDDLNNLVNKAMDQTDSNSSKLESRLNSMNTLTGTAKDAAKTLADESAKDIDHAASSVANAANTVKNSLSGFSKTADEVNRFLKDVQSAAGQMSSSLSSYLNGMNISEEDKKELNADWNSFQDATRAIQTGLTNLSQDMNNTSLTTEQILSKVRTDFQQIEDAYGRIADAVNQMYARVGSDVENGKNFIENLYQQVKNARDTLNGEFQKVQSDLNTIRKNIRTGNFHRTDLSSLRDSVNTLQNDLKDKLNPATKEEKIREALSEIKVPDQTIGDVIGSWKAYQEAFQSVLDANRAELSDTADDIAGKADSVTKTLADALTAESSALDSVVSSLNTVRPYLDAVKNTDGVSSSVKTLKDVLNNYPDVSRELTDALDSLASLDLQVNGVSDTLKQNADNLYQSLGGIENEMNGLNSDLTTVTGEGTDSLRAITAQIHTISQTLQAAAKDAENPGDDRSVEDISDENIRETSEGRATECMNNGDVEADTNVGGIVGMMGVEYSLDPETDIKTTGDTSLNYIFRMKCIVDNCTNNGTVGARGSYSGGISGQMEMGLVASSRNFGNLSSESNYVGGVSGYTTGLVRNTLAKCDLSGKKYVGGIAGYGVDLHDNYAMVNAVDTKEYTGAIAGRVKNVNAADVYRNYYYSTKIYGINGVSYAGIAEGQSYEDLSAKYLADGNAVKDLSGTADNENGMENRFTQLTLTFCTDDDAVVKTLHVGYGDSVPKEQLPEVPDKEGFYGEWSRTDYSRIVSDETITAEYSRINTLLSSDKTRKSGPAVAEAAGRFKEKDFLGLKKLKAQAGETERWQMTIPDDGEETHEVRYLTPDESTDATVYVIRDGRKTKVKTGEFGKYLTFQIDKKSDILTEGGTAEAESYTVIFAVKESSSMGRIVRNIVIIAVVAAAGAFVIIRGIRKKKRNKKANS